MAHITTCTKCGRAYEETSEENANALERICPWCSDGKPFSDQFRECKVGGNAKEIEVTNGFTKFKIMLCIKNSCQCRSSVCREERGVEVKGWSPPTKEATDEDL